MKRGFIFIIAFTFILSACNINKAVKSITYDEIIDLQIKQYNEDNNSSLAREDVKIMSLRAYKPEILNTMAPNSQPTKNAQKTYIISESLENAYNDLVNILNENYFSSSHGNYKNSVDEIVIQIQYNSTYANNNYSISNMSIIASPNDCRIYSVNKKISLSADEPEKVYEELSGFFEKYYNDFTESEDVNEEGNSNVG